MVIGEDIGLSCKPLEAAWRGYEALMLTLVILSDLDVPLPHVLEARVHVYHDPGAGLGII